MWIGCCAHRQWFRPAIADNMGGDLAGGQGDAETRPERRARDQDRRRDAKGVPFLFRLSGIGPEAINLGGAGGQSPPGRHLRRAWKLCVVRSWCVSGQPAAAVWIAVLCLRVRSQPFFWYGAVTDATVCPVPYPAAPHTHPFVDSTAEGSAVVRPSGEGPARIISRSTVPPARVVSIRLTSGAAAVATTTVPIHGALQTDSHRGGTTPPGAPFRCNRLSSLHSC